MVLHQPVLLDEVLAGLAIQPDGIYIDGTFGRGGHARAILQHLGPRGRLIGFDKDPEAIEYAKTHIQDERLKLIHASFAKMLPYLSEQVLEGQVAGILLDLGVSSPQLDTPERGFSFLREGPLDMRMDPTTGMSAAHWLAVVDETTLANVIFQLGDERFSRRIASAIVLARKTTAITSTGQLAAIVAKACPRREVGKHPATRTFQAIRIFINHELEEVEVALTQALTLLRVGGRLAVISFHSLEDRIVKQFMRRESSPPPLPRHIPVRGQDFCPRLQVVGRAIMPSANEIEINPRARSAVLRIAEKKT